MADKSTWRTNVFRQDVIAKIEKAIGQSGRNFKRNGSELENYAFCMAKTKKEYLTLVAKFIYFFKIEPKKEESGSGQVQNLANHNVPQPGQLGVPKQITTSNLLQAPKQQIMANMQENMRKTLPEQLYCFKEKQNLGISPNSGPMGSGHIGNELANQNRIQLMQNSGGHSSSPEDSDNTDAGSQESDSGDETEPVIPKSQTVLLQVPSPNYSTETDSSMDSTLSQDALPSKGKVNPVSDVNIREQTQRSYQSTSKLPIGNTPSTVNNPTVGKANQVERLTLCIPTGSNTTVDEARPSTSRGEVNERHETSKTVTKNHFLEAVVPSTSSSGSGVASPQIGRRLKWLRRNKKIYTSKQLKRLYFMKKIEISNFELHSKKTLHKLECTIKKHQLEQLC